MPTPLNDENETPLTFQGMPIVTTDTLPASLGPWFASDRELEELRALIHAKPRSEPLANSTD